MITKRKKSAAKTFLSTTSYYSDLANANTLYAVLVRSPISSGTIRSIELSDIPEGYNLFTADDLPNDIPIKVFETSFPIFAKAKVSYLGEPIGILTGPSLILVQELAQKIQIVFTEVFIQAEDKKRNNSTIASRSFTYGSYKVQKKELTHHIETKSIIQLEQDETTETNGALCYASGKKLNIYTPTLWQKNVRENLEAITGYSSENIIIHKTQLPITEKNSPWKNTTLVVQCAIASILTKKSVLLTLSHDEQRDYDNLQNEVSITHSSIVSDDGKLLSCDVSITLDIGAYNPFTPIFVDRLAIGAIGAYCATKLQVEVNAITSAKPPTTSIMRWLDYHCFYAIETHISEIAKTIDVNPSEMRIKNIFKNDKKYPFQFDTNTYNTILETVIQKSDFNRKYEAYKLNSYSEKSKKLFFPVRGIGLATAYEANGFLGTMIDTAVQSLEVSIEINGKVIIKVLNASETIASIWKEIASSILSVSTDDITIDSLFYQNEETTVPETMLSNMYITAQLLKKACLAVQKMRFHQPLPISVRRTFNATNKKTWNSETFTGKPFYVTSWIALVAEIELVLPIYSYEVRNIYISIDAGNVMNKRKARYAIQSCVKKILAQAMKNQTYTDPDILITFLDSSDEPKQIRELVYSALPAAISNALSQTVQQNLHKYPLEQEKLFEMFETIHSLQNMSSNDAQKEFEENDNEDNN